MPLTQTDTHTTYSYTVKTETYIHEYNHAYTGTETRKLAAKYVKQAKVVTSLKELHDLFADVAELQEYASDLQEWHYYENDYEPAENETPEGWRFERANDVCNKLMEKLDERIDILETRIERKLQQSIERRAA